MIEEHLIFSTLYDHYKESVNTQKKDCEKRDKVTIYVVLSFIVLYLFEFIPEESTGIANELIKEQIHLSVVVNYNIISTVILSSIVLILVRYFQLCIGIERQYRYIHALEDRLNSMIKGDIFTKEGCNYLKDYPLLLDFVHIVYNYIIPFLLVALSGIKTYYFISGSNINVIVLINILVGFSIILVTSLYILFLHQKIWFFRKIDQDIRWVVKMIKSFLRWFYQAVFKRLNIYN